MSPLILEKWLQMTKYQNTCSDTCQYQKGLNLIYSSLYSTVFIFPSFTHIKTSWSSTLTFVSPFWTSNKISNLWVSYIVFFFLLKSKLCFDSNSPTSRIGFVKLKPRLEHIISLAICQNKDMTTKGHTDSKCYSLNKEMLALLLTLNCDDPTAP